MFEFLIRHPTVPFLVASGFIFYDGYRSFAEGKKSVAFQWQILAAILLVLDLATAAFYHSWTSLAVIAAALSVEIRLMVRWYSKGT